ncbi:DgyrCDS4587 [Dimorphilus gyrociliatus]|uniref:DgyrCDS4587 n=1 Tax=Dimorphilus gyrociliatus TaxID=2664684 RepID=A0A7I8VK33_9ANNE|nr:DgyrCDS4587 [Dimorphilus gyrociliatus]
MSDEDLLKIWVGNFPYGTTEEELRNIFESYKIRSVDLVNTTEAGKTASAILIVEDPELAVRQMDGYTFKGRPIGVRIANKISPDRRNNTHQLDRCKILIQQVQPMLYNILDKCSYCTAIKSLITELSWTLQEDHHTNGLSHNATASQHHAHGAIRDHMLTVPSQYVAAAENYPYSKPEAYMTQPFQYRPYSNSASPVPPGVAISSRPPRNFVQSPPNHIRSAPQPNLPW